MKELLLLFTDGTFLLRYIVFLIAVGQFVKAMPLLNAIYFWLCLPVGLPALILYMIYRRLNPPKPPKPGEHRCGMEILFELLEILVWPAFVPEYITKALGGGDAREKKKYHHQ